MSVSNALNLSFRRGLVATDPPFLTFHLWLLINLAAAFAMFIAIKTGGLGFVIDNDSTYISSAILVFFLASSIYCGTRAWLLSRELIAVQHAAGHEISAGNLRRARIESTSVNAVIQDQAEQSGLARPASADQGLQEALEEKLLGPHEIGWFITESLTKLGLLGTVIGFLIMLTALVGSNQLELSAMQMILRDMASGMGIKIIATVVGLLCNMVLALQWVLLDRCAQKVLNAAKVIGVRPS